jgi:uncharacterized protein
MPNKKQNMSIENFNKINEYYLDKLNKNKIDYVYYRLAGGEPLLVFNKYKDELKRFISSNPKKIHIEIITNLTIIPSKLIDLLKEYPYNIGLCVSLDSLEYSKPYHNGNSSSQIVINNIKTIKNMSPKTSISISTVITDNAKHLKDMVKYVADNEISIWDMSFDNYAENNVDIEAIKENLNNLILEVEKNKYSFLRIRFNGINFKNNSGCGAGENLICIDTNGDVYPCQTLLEIEKEKLGNIFNENLKNYIKVGCDKICSECSIFEYCAGECKYHNCRRRKQYFCPLVKYYVYEVGKILLKE